MNIRIFTFRVFLLTLLSLSGLQLKALAPRIFSLSDTIDVVSYELYLTVTNVAQQSISGQAGIRFTTPLSSQQQLILELLQLQVDSVMNDEGAMLPYSHNGTRLTIDLPAAVGAGDTALVYVYYHGQPFHESWGGFHFSGSYAFNLGVGFESIPHNLGKAWFPCVDDFRDRALYDYYIRVANTNTAVCGGLLQSISTMCDGTVMYHWKMERSIPTYLASVAIGPYALVTDSVTGIQSTIPVRYYVHPSDTIRARNSFANMGLVTTAYENAFGPYPFERIGITGTSLGAMEHAGNIFYPNGSINGTLSDEWLYAHELSHMWFGNMVTCSSDGDMWLNEGWARWCETYYREVLYGTGVARDNFRTLLRNVLQYIHTKEGGYIPLSPMPSIYTYGDNVYDKGGITSQALRGYLGDSLFFAGIKAYLQAFAYSPASSEDLRDFMSDYTGIDLTDFFDVHVFGAGFNQYSVDSMRVTPQGNDYLAQVFINQRLKGPAQPAQNNRVLLTFFDAQWHRFDAKAIYTGVYGSNSFLLPFEPVLVVVDADEQMADATTDAFKTITATGLYDYTDTWFKLDVMSVSDSALVRVVHNWVPPDSLKTPVPGLRLSDYRYWTIEGIFPEIFDATGRFWYNRNAALDNTLLLSAADSLVILYRATTANDWQPVEFTKVGPWQLGTLYVPHIRPGDYALAVYSQTTSSTTGSLPQPWLKAFPNPASEMVNIETFIGETAHLTVTDSAGSPVFRSEVPAGRHSLQWNCSKLPPGSYIVQVAGNQAKIAVSKLILTR